MIKIGLTNYKEGDLILDIRDKDQVIKAKYAIGDKDVEKFNLMKEHYIELSFFLDKYMPLKRADYIEWEGMKFILKNDYKPSEINKKKHEYKLKFEALWVILADIQYYYLNQDLKESEWRLTGNPQYFFKIGIDNINRYFGTTLFNLGVVEIDEIEDISFALNTNTFDAFNQIAEKYEAEWYFTGYTLNFVKKVSFGSEIEFETDSSIRSISRSEGEKNGKYNRIVALGSTRNIPRSYREPVSGEAVDSIYQKRLRIPIDKGDVIDAHENMSPEEVIEGTVIFDEIYPKRIGTIEAVGTIEYKDTDSETGEVTKWNAYKFKDSGLNFKEEYMLPGQELRIVFESGNMKGMDFALTFHDKDFTNSDKSQYFEIIRNEDYGKPLPNETLRPKVGDTYAIYGFNIQLVSDAFVPAAEQELYEKASAWLKDSLKDKGVYDCKTMIQYFSDNEMDLDVGQKVKLVHEQFDNGSRSSRIMGYEKKLINKYDASYKIGDNAAYSRLASIESKIDELQYAGQVFQSSGGNGVYLIKQFDNVRPSDHNAYSAKASDAKYFNKQTGGTVQGDTAFQKNVEIQGKAFADEFGNMTSTIGPFGSGFRFWRDKTTGDSHGEVDYLRVRKEMLVSQLTIDEIKSVGGTILLSLAHLEITKVEDTTTYWRVYFDNDNGNNPNQFVVNDQVICQKCK